MLADVLLGDRESFSGVGSHASPKNALADVRYFCQKVVRRQKRARHFARHSYLSIYIIVYVHLSTL